jgi:hypothetical protein
MGFVSECNAINFQAMGIETEYAVQSLAQLFVLAKHKPRTVY